MKTHLVLTILILCATANTSGAHKFVTGNYLDSLMRIESINASKNPVTWDLNKKLGLANFVLKDEWVWAKMLDAGMLDTGHNYKIYLVGQNDRAVGITEFRAVFAADLAHADTLLYNFRVLCAAKDKHAKSHTVLFERAYEAAYARNPNGAAIVTR
jgi:hypothetical protein